MAEPMAAKDIAAKLIADHKWALRNVFDAKRANDRFMADCDDWSVWAVVSEVVEMAHGFTVLETQDFIRIMIAEV